MKIVIMSDSHRHDSNVREVIRRMKPFDMLVHLGDTEGSENLIRGWCLEQNPDCEVHIVRGNNDFFTELPREEEFMVGKYHVFATHGHNYGVSMGTERILDEGLDRGAQIVMFGHTHRPLIEESGGIVLLNPGSISYPRQEGRAYTFIQMEIDRSGEAHYTLSKL
jgi:putative phosphoesterase